MLSEKQHIDEYFRKKEDAFSPEIPFIDEHWLQLKRQLTTPATVAATDKIKTHVKRHFIKYLGGFVLVTIITILTINPVRYVKRTTSTKTKLPATRAVATKIPAAKPLAAAASTTPAKSKQVIKRTSSMALRVRSAVKRGPVKKPNETVVEKTSNTPSEQSTAEKYTARARYQPDAAELLNAFYRQLKNEEQEFTIPANRDTTLIAKEGTRLVIAANSFTGKQGMIKKGTVTIIVSEYYRYEDMVAAKLSTTSNNQQLETGGMVHITAQQDGEEVLLAPQKAITINMPTNNYDSRMQLFLGTEQASSKIKTDGDTAKYDYTNNATINWVAAEQVRPGASLRRQKVKVLNLNVVEPYAVSYGKKTTARFYAGRGIVIPKTALALALKERFGSYYDRIKIKRAPKKMDYSNGDEPQLVIDSVFMDLHKAFAKKLIPQKDSAYYVALVKQDSINNEKQLRLLKYYNFTINNLGWINCDRFSNDPRPKTNFTLNLGDGLDTYSHISQLVFTRYQSIMNGYNGNNRVQFPGVPIGEPVQLISLAVKDGQVVSCIQTLTISTNEISKPVFEPTTPAQFKQKLQALFASRYNYKN